MLSARNLGGGKQIKGQHIFGWRIAPKSTSHGYIYIGRTHLHEIDSILWQLIEEGVERLRVPFGEVGLRCGFACKSGGEISWRR